MTDRAPLVFKPRDYTRRSCDHKQSLIDEQSRTLECADCGAPLDPFTYLVQIANGFRSLDYRLEEEREYYERRAAATIKAKAKRQQKEEWRRLAEACDECSGIRAVDDRIRTHRQIHGKRDAKRLDALRAEWKDGVK